MSNASKPINIAIAGGGIAGLCLARGLSQCPIFNVTVYEATAKYLDIGGGLAFHGNAIRALELIDPELQAEYFRRATAMSELDIEMATEVRIGDVEGADGRGRLLAELGKAKGRKTVARADLLDGLLSLVPADMLRFGKRLVGIEEVDGAISLAFKDGTTARADVLIGCDGVHSATRSYLLGPNHPAVGLKNHDAWSWNTRLVPAEEVNALNPKLMESVEILCGHGSYMAHFPIHRGQTITLHVVQKGKDTSAPHRAYDPADSSAKDTSGDQNDKLDLTQYTHWSQGARDLAELASRDTTNWWKLADHDPAPLYARRNIAMAGDAAHATMPFNGQGAAQSIEDAAVLTALFREVRDLTQVEAALRAYETVRKPRTQRVAELSRKFGRMYAFAEPGIEDDVGKLMKAFGEGAKYTNDVDLAAQNEEALRVFKAEL